MTAQQVRIDVAGLTDVGVARKNNEDALLLADFLTRQVYDGAMQQERSLADNSLLVIVSDGVGGAAVGELASQLTVHSIYDALNRLSQSIPAYDRLVASVEQANYVVYNESRREQKYHGMAATVTAIMVERDQAYIAEVGDSRAYLLRKNRIAQITNDQSLVELMIKKGLLTADQAIRHPRKNVILQAIGSTEAVQVAVGQVTLQRDDYLLVCSDGLSNNVLEQEMLQIINGTDTLPLACQQMINLANARGGKDNITVAIAHFSGEGLPDTLSRELTRPMVETLAVFDPERTTEKTHKRTMLLGDAMRFVEPDQVLEDLHSYPGNEVIQDQHLRLQTLLNQSLAVLDEQTNEVNQAFCWVNSQRARYPRKEDLEAKLASVRERLDQAQQTLEEISAEFSPKIVADSAETQN